MEKKVGERETAREMADAVANALPADAAILVAAGSVLLGILAARRLNSWGGISPPESRRAGC